MIAIAAESAHWLTWLDPFWVIEAVLLAFSQISRLLLPGRQDNNFERKQA